MSAIANIAVYDGAATPVLHTLVAVSVTREKGKVTAAWREQLASLPAYAQVSALMSIERLKSGVYKTVTRVEVPVMESVSGQNAAGYTAAPRVAHVDTVETVGYFHERSSVTSRRLARQISVNIGNNVSTSVAAASTGPMPELIDQLVAPT
jgi:hypothetical protein